jgi:hypothetical protein
MCIYWRINSFFSSSFQGIHLEQYFRPFYWIIWENTVKQSFSKVGPSEKLTIKTYRTSFKDVSLKGQCHEIFCFRFFHESSSPKPLKTTLGNLGSFRFFLQNRRDIRKSRFTTGINNNGGEFATSYHWHWWQILPPVPLVLLILVENFWISSKPKLGPLVQETVDLIPIENKKISKLHYQCLGAGVHLKSSQLYCSDQF